MIQGNIFGQANWGPPSYPNLRQGSLKITRVKRPAYVGMVMDACGEWAGWGYTIAYIHGPVGVPWNLADIGTWICILAPRHKGGGCICFFDGHVEWVKWEDARDSKNDMFAHYSL